MLLMETALELAMHDLNVAQVWASDMKEVISPPDPNAEDFTSEQYLTIAKEVLEDQNEQRSDD
jgi:hypothetical protein